MSMGISIRLWNKPEIIITYENYKKLSNFVGKNVGLVPAGILNKTRSGRMYYEGTMIEHDCYDDDLNPTSNKCYAIKTNNCTYHIEIGDGLFVNHLPTQPKVWTPDEN